MKKLFTLVFLLTSLCLCINAIDITVKNSDGNTYYYNITDSYERTVEMTSRDGKNICTPSNYAGSIVIPATVNFEGKIYTVTSIANYVFAFCRSLNEVSIPQSITKIGDYAFYGCNAISSITIPTNVKEIGKFAFADCTNLKTLNYNATSCSDFTTIDRYHTSPFFKSPIEDVNIGNNVNHIPSGFLFRCNTLKSIDIPESVTSIGMGAFRTCTALEEINIPKSVNHIGSYAFINTAWVKNQAEGPLYINDMLYTYNGEMPENTAVIVKAGTTKICGCALATIDDQNSKILEQPNLTSLSIPASVMEIGDRAFYRCKSITEIISAAHLPSIIVEEYRTVFSYDDLNALGTVVTVPMTATSTYEDTYGWKNFNYVKRVNEDLSEENSQMGYEQLVYPNPASEFIYVETSDDVKTISLYNIQGVLINSVNAQGSTTQIPVGNLTDGVYIIKTISENGVTVNSKFTKI